MEDNQQNYESIEQEVDELVQKFKQVMTKKESCDIINRIKNIMDSCPESEKIALDYAILLTDLTLEQNSIKELEKVVSELELLYKREEFKNSDSLAICYALGLFNLSVIQAPSIDEMKHTISRLYNLFQNHQKKDDVAKYYALSMSNLLASLQKESKNIIAEDTYRNKICGLYKQFPDSKDIVLAYSVTLVNLSDIQNNRKEMEDLKKEISDIYRKFSDSEEIGYCYLELLGNMFVNKYFEDKRQDIFDEAQKIYDKFSASDLIVLTFPKFISDSLTDDISKYKTILPDRISLALDNEILKVERRTIISVDIYEKLKEISKLRFLSGTKYEILQNFILENIDRNITDINFKRLLEVYLLVQKIKFQLAVKNNQLSDLTFGHYTSAKVLQLLLRQEDNIVFQNEELKKYHITSKSRLNNANYMNDPAEGTKLDEVLMFGSKDNLEPSPWFLMSLTTATDDLAMWSQYGRDAEGVCITLKYDSFKGFKNISDAGWMSTELGSRNRTLKMTLSCVDIEQDSLNIAVSQDQNYQKDYLYRVAYLNQQGKLVQTDLFDDDSEFEDIQKILKELQNAVKDIDEKDELYKVIDSCLEEIRYLFKSSDYSYESELRVLRYANLAPDNETIKVDNSGEVAKLYVERNEPIQIKKVIFGPKFKDPDHVTPLLRMLDKDIEFERSKIKFR